MRATEAFATALESGRDWLVGLVGDLKGDELVAQPTANGGNHALWVLGHLALSEATIVSRLVLGMENPLESWEATYGMGSVPTANAGDYAPVEELLGKLEEVRQATLKVLADMPDAELDEPSKSDYAMFDTKGKCFAMLVSHQAFHAGQVSVVRKALGKKPAFG